MHSQYGTVKQTIGLMDWIEKYGPEVSEKELAIAKGKLEILLWVLELPSNATREQVASLV